MDIQTKFVKLVELKSAEIDHVNEYATPKWPGTAAAVIWEAMCVDMAALGRLMHEADEGLLEAAEEFVRWSRRPDYGAWLRGGYESDMYPKEPEWLLWWREPYSVEREEA